LKFSKFIRINYRDYLLGVFYFYSKIGTRFFVETVFRLTFAEILIVKTNELLIN